MKANNLLRMNMKEIVKKNRDLTIIYACAIASSVVLILGWGVLETPDSPSYISAWDNYANGKIDVFRTPVYPIFLGIMKLIFGASFFCSAAICVQHVIFQISIFCFYKIAQILISVRRIVFLISLFYATLSLFTTWNNFIMTESLAISGVVIHIYTILCLRRTSSYTSAISYTLILFILIFLRPAFVYMLPIFILLWIYMIFVKEKRKAALLGISGTLIVVVSLFSYMKIFEREYALFASSEVNTVNQIHIARSHGLLNPNIIKDKDLREHIIESYKKYGQNMEDNTEIWIESYNILKVHGLKTVNDAIIGSYKDDPKGWMAACGSRFVKSCYKPLFISHIDKSQIIYDICLNPTMRVFYYFMFIYTIILCLWINRSHCIPWMSMLFYSMCLSNIIVVIWGAQDSWSRLTLPSMPLFLLMLGQICTMFKASPISSIRFR